MAQFATVATAHFVALLIPGIDFFLIARTGSTGGWRRATGACLGIATANAILIAAAFSGVALVSNPGVIPRWSWPAAASSSSSGSRSSPHRPASTWTPTRRPPAPPG